MKHFSIQKKTGALLSSLLITGLALTPVAAFASDGGNGSQANEPQELVKHEQAASSNLDPSIKEQINREEYRVETGSSWTKLFHNRGEVNGHDWQGPFNLLEDKKHFGKSWSTEWYKMSFGHSYNPYRGDYVSKEFLEGLLKGAPQGKTIREYVSAELGIKIPSNVKYLVAYYDASQTIDLLSRDTLQVDLKFIYIDKEYDGKWREGTYFRAYVAKDFGLDWGKYDDAAFKKCRTSIYVGVPSGELFAIRGLDKRVFMDD